MKTIDEILKIKAALLYVIDKFGDEGVDYIKLFKILYFAQQEHLILYGRGVIDDTFHALRHGPVPSFIYKSLQMIDGRIAVEPDFNDFINGISVDGNAKVHCHISPDMDELSTTDIKVLNDSIIKYKDIPSFQLSEMSHDTAWEEAYNRAQFDPEKDRMTLIDIAIAGGADAQMIEFIRENIIIDNALR